MFFHISPDHNEGVLRPSLNFQYTNILFSFFGLNKDITLFSRNAITFPLLCGNSNGEQPPVYAVKQASSGADNPSKVSTVPTQISSAFC